MSVESQIIAAVEAYAPCYANGYTGTATTYFVIYSDIIPANYGDDTPQHVRHLVQLHFFAPITTNTVTLRKQVCRAIQTAGFTYPSIVNASDETGVRLIFEFQAIEEA